MGFIKKVLTEKPSVLRLLHAETTSSQTARDPKVLHASDLTDDQKSFCPREFALMRRVGVRKKPKYINPSLRMTFDEGMDKQNRITNDYLRDYMVGPWSCVLCGSTEEWHVGPPADTGCKRGTHAWWYQEPVFTHPSGFSGSIDGLIAFNAKTIRPLEVKILKGDELLVLKAPMAEHRIRTRLYLRLIAESTNNPHRDSIDTSCAHLLYVMRGFGRVVDGVMTPFLEFTVSRDDTDTDHYIELAERASAGMPTGICGTALDKRAKNCKV